MILLRRANDFHFLCRAACAYLITMKLIAQARENQFTEQQERYEYPTFLEFVMSPVNRTARKLWDLQILFCIGNNQHVVISLKQTCTS